MSSSLSTMPFSRRYGSLRMPATGSTDTCSPATNANLRVSHALRHSSGIEAASGPVASATRLQMVSLGYRASNNPARNVSNSWIGNDESAASTFAAAMRQHKISSSQRPGTTAATAGKQSHADRCAVHPAKKLDEMIADTPLLQSPRIIARSARIVEPNAWNRRLTTSSFCAVAGAPASQQKPTASGRFLQTPLTAACRKSPGSSGTSVESIVPKYTRTAGNGGRPVGVESTTAAQKRTHNAHKPQLRTVSGRVHANINGRVGTVSKKLTGPSHGARNDAEREVARVLHHHNMRVMDNMLNMQHMQQQQSHRVGHAPNENNENHQPAVTHNGGRKVQAGSRKGTAAVPPRLPLADREKPTDRNRSLLVCDGGGECFSSKYPNGLPFEREFYARRTANGGDAETQPATEPAQAAADEVPDKHMAKLAGALGRRRAVPTAQQEPSHRSRSVSSSDGTVDADGRRSLSASEREHEGEDALYVDFTKVHDPNGGDHAGEPQTSVVECRNISHSSYYYKFESVSARRKDAAAPHGRDASGDRQELRSRYQRSRLGLNQTCRGKPDVNGNGGREYCDEDAVAFNSGGERDEEEEEDEEGEGEGEEEEGGRSLVYVAVATWVPRCNRLPSESSETNNNSICLTVVGSGDEDSGELLQQRQQPPRPTAVADAAAAPLAPPRNRKGLFMSTSSRDGKLNAGPGRWERELNNDNQLPTTSRAVPPASRWEREINNDNQLPTTSRAVPPASSLRPVTRLQRRQVEQAQEQHCTASHHYEETRIAPHANGQAAQNGTVTNITTQKPALPSGPVAPPTIPTATATIDARNKRSKSPPRSCSGGKSAAKMSNGASGAEAVVNGGGGIGGVGGAAGAASTIPNTIRGSGPNGELTLKDVPVSGISFQEIFKPDHEGPPTTQVIIYKPKSGKGQPTAKVIVTKSEQRLEHREQRPDLPPHLLPLHEGHQMQQPPPVVDAGLTEMERSRMHQDVFNLNAVTGEQRGEMMPRPLQPVPQLYAQAAAQQGSNHRHEYGQGWPAARYICHGTPAGFPMYAASPYPVQLPTPPAFRQPVEHQFDNRDYREHYSRMPGQHAAAAPVRPSHSSSSILDRSREMHAAGPAFEQAVTPEHLLGSANRAPAAMLSSAEYAPCAVQSVAPVRLAQSSSSPALGPSDRYEQRVMASRMFAPAEQQQNFAAPYAAYPRLHSALTRFWQDNAANREPQSQYRTWNYDRIMARTDEPFANVQRPAAATIAHTGAVTAPPMQPPALSTFHQPPPPVGQHPPPPRSLLHTTRNQQMLSSYLPLPAYPTPGMPYYQQAQHTPPTLPSRVVREELFTVQVAPGNPLVSVAAVIPQSSPATPSPAAHPDTAAGANEDDPEVVRYAERPVGAAASVPSPSLPPSCSPRSAHLSNFPIDLRSPARRRAAACDVVDVLASPVSSRAVPSPSASSASTPCAVREQSLTQQEGQQQQHHQHQHHHQEEQHTDGDPYYFRPVTNVRECHSGSAGGLIDIDIPVPIRPVLQDPRGSVIRYLPHPEQPAPGCSEPYLEDTTDDEEEEEDEEEVLVEEVEEEEEVEEGEEEDDDVTSESDGEQQQQQQQQDAHEGDGEVFAGPSDRTPVSANTSAPRDQSLYGLQLERQPWNSPAVAGSSRSHRYYDHYERYEATLCPPDGRLPPQQQHPHQQQWQSLQLLRSLSATTDTDASSTVATSETSARDRRYAEVTEENCTPNDIEVQYYTHYRRN